MAIFAIFVSLLPRKPLDKNVQKFGNVIIFLTSTSDKNFIDIEEEEVKNSIFWVDLVCFDSSTTVVLKLFQLVAH